MASAGQNQRVRLRVRGYDQFTSRNASLGRGISGGRGGHDLASICGGSGASAVVVGTDDVSGREYLCGPGFTSDDSVVNV